MDLQVCVPDCVTDLSVCETVSAALMGRVGVHAVEVGIQGGGSRLECPDASRPAQDAPKKRRRRRVNANGEKCEVVDNGDGTVTETRR